MSRRRQPRKEGLGRTPVPLKSPSADKVIYACGEHIDLVIDNVFNDMFMDDAGTMCHMQTASQLLNIYNVSLRPLQRALLAQHADCQCSPFSRLHIRSIVLSGSIAECLYTPVSQPANGMTSDADQMFELGPVSWEFPDADETSAVERISAGPARDSLSGLKDQHNDSLPRLAIVETENPGFVLLLQKRMDDCPHEGMLPFKSEEVNQFMSEYLQCGAFGMEIMHTSNNGPATSYQVPSNTLVSVADRDDVPCLHVPVWWFSDEFFTRPRRCDWPPETVRDKIKQFGLHVVPVGAAGSETEKYEWRLSFSMAEVLIAYILTETQKSTIRAFKVCKRTLGEEAKVVKSYYMKTALMWLCERIPENDWTSITWGVLQLVKFLLDAVKKGNLPCFFWSRINLFRSVSRADRRNMKKVLEDVRKNLMRLVSGEVFSMTSCLPGMIAQEGRRLTERQLRVCLARYLIKHVCEFNIYMYIGAFILGIFDDQLPALSRSWSPDELSIMLRSYQHWRMVQKGLFRALTVVPDDVASQVRLSDSGDGGFVWDAAPLLALLTDDDMKELLGDPEAVRAWLRRQHQRPKAEQPPGLPADLSSPRDRCDLLLNTPLLCWALRESVPVKWFCLYQGTKTVTKAGRWPHGCLKPSTALSNSCLIVKYQVGTLAADNLRNRLGMDDQTVELILARFRQEMAKFSNDGGSRADMEMLLRSQPDYWDIWHFVLAHLR